MLPRKAELVSEKTGRSGQEKCNAVTVFHRSNGLDTALYKIKRVHTVLTDGGTAQVSTMSSSLFCRWIACCGS